MSVVRAHVAAVVSMLHESAGAHSASRRFRNQPVLRWTLSRLGRCKAIDTITVLCWDDQADAVAAVTAACDGDVVDVKSIGARRAIAAMDAIATARRWADGWRGGLLGSCEFDLGFDAESVQAVAASHDADAVVLIDPAAGLVDPVLIEDLIEHAENRPQAELVFSPAAPGLSGVLLRRALVDRLTVAKIHPGRLLTYWPDQHGVDPIGKDGCAPVPTAAARTSHRFKLDSARQLTRLDAATVSLNGQLMVTDAEGLVARMRDQSGAEDLLPRDVVLELNTTRLSRPIYWPGLSLEVQRAELPVEPARILFDELARLDDVRLTLAGVGDPLCAAEFFELVAAAKAAGVGAIHVETDLLCESAETIAALARCGVDVVSVHLPAASAKTYAAVMNTDGFARAMHNVRLLELAVQQGQKRGPLIVPTFTKTAGNLAEMDCWYDYWIRRMGHAVIAGPSDFAGQIADTAVADMSPPKRRACGRLWSRVNILCDGRVVSCEQDVLGKQTLGRIGQMPLTEIWKQPFGSLRGCHRAGRWDEQPLCKGCREWHRP